ncbi:MAG: GIY-YIG nuclease family protein [Cyclobacteriaceae bacterium]
MYIVYVLFSERYNKTYVGYTSNLEDRIKSHNELATKGYTVHYRPWIVAFTEVYSTKTAAMKREKALKAGQGRQYIKEQLLKLGLISA